VNEEKIGVMIDAPGKQIHEPSINEHDLNIFRFRLSSLSSLPSVQSLGCGRSSRRAFLFNSFDSGDSSESWLRLFLSIALRAMVARRRWENLVR
jgi:hypothetical protein